MKRRGYRGLHQSLSRKRNKEGAPSDWDRFNKAQLLREREEKAMSKPLLDIPLALAVLRKTHKPHWLCKDLNGDLWEFISWPYVVNERLIAVKIRIPGDPTSMITANALRLDPEDMECACGWAKDVLGLENFYLRPEYYAKRHARLLECPARVEEP